MTIKNCCRLQVRENKIRSQEIGEKRSKFNILDKNKELILPPGRNGQTNVSKKHPTGIVLSIG
jgi:hypothetical protein